MAGEWTGFEDGDLKLNFGGDVFNVHRVMFAQASPVWKAMMTGPFAESKEDTIDFDGDDPQVARLCIELMYLTSADSDLDWTGIESRVMADRDTFDAFVDKYDVQGVKKLVSHELDMRKKTRQLKDENQGLQHELAELKRKFEPFATKSGNLVDCNVYTPDVGKSVRRYLADRSQKAGLGSRRNSTLAGRQDADPLHVYTRIGVIIANDEGPTGTLIGVRWRDGEESHRMVCEGNNKPLEYFS